jgi:HEAT repeat protein
VTYEPELERPLEDDENESDDLLEWDESDGAEAVTLRHPDMSLAAVLALLSGPGALPSLNNLYVLSDLSRGDSELVRERWPVIAVERRRAVVEELVNAAHDDITLLLGRFLRLAITDPDDYVRLRAVEGLWEDVAPDLVGPLVQMLANDSAAELRAAAARSLGPFVLAGELEEMDAALSMRAEEALLAALHDSREALSVRCRALESVAYSGEAGVRQLIEDAYYAADDEMRVAALTAMGRSADVRWRSVVRAELKSPSSAMRAEAAWACGELEAHNAVNDLLELLLDDVQTVRLATILALGHLGGRDAKNALGIVAAGDDPIEAEAAELALEEMLFYADDQGVSLYDEPEDEEEDLDNEPWDPWYDGMGHDLGTDDE